MCVNGEDAYCTNIHTLNTKKVVGTFHSLQNTPTIVDKEMHGALTSRMRDISLCYSDLYGVGLGRSEIRLKFAGIVWTGAG